MTLLPTNPSGHPVERHAPGADAIRRFTPARTTAPAGWYLVLQLLGRTASRSAARATSRSTAQGRVWANTNATVVEQPAQGLPGQVCLPARPVCARASRSTGSPAAASTAPGSGSPSTRASRSGSRNFGFTGFVLPRRCPSSEQRVGSSARTGRPLSADDGYLDGPLSWPQGVKSDVARQHLDRQLRQEQPRRVPRRRPPPGPDGREQDIDRAFDVAQNTVGNIFVTANGDDLVYGFRPERHGAARVAVRRLDGGF